MNPTNLRTLKILEELGKEQVPSQRDLAKKLNISLGLANSFIKRLAQKGFFKITTMPKQRIRYMLTPAGIAEKTRLSYEYMQYALELYRNARKKMRRLFNTLEKEGVRRVVFYGAGDLAEIAFITLQETRISMIALADESEAGKPFLGKTICKLERIDPQTYDKIILTADISPKDAIKQIKAYRLPWEKIVVMA